MVIYHHDHRHTHTDTHTNHDHTHHYYHYHHHHHHVFALESVSMYTSKLLRCVQTSYQIGEVHMRHVLSFRLFTC